MGLRSVRALCSALLLVLISPSEASARCRVTAKKMKQVIDQGCSTRRTTAVVVNVKGTVKVKISGDDLSCGGVKLRGWKAAEKAGLETCKDGEGSAGELEYGVSFRVVARMPGKFVAVDRLSGGYTGGAHPTAYHDRRSYHWKTGKELTLKHLFPKRHATYLKRLRSLFSARKEHEGYRFEPRAFALVERGKRRWLEFAMPHNVEVNRGTTLNLRLGLTSGPSR